MGFIVTFSDMHVSTLIIITSYKLKFESLCLIQISSESRSKDIFKASSLSTRNKLMLIQSSKSKDAFFSARTLKIQSVNTLNNTNVNIKLGRYGHYIISSQIEYMYNCAYIM